MPAMLPPAFLAELPKHDPDTHCLKKAFHEADTMVAALNHFPTIPTAIRSQTVSRLKSLRAQIHERLSGDVARPMTPALAADLVRRRRMALMIEELEAQVRPAPPLALEGKVAKVKALPAWSRATAIPLDQNCVGF